MEFPLDVQRLHSGQSLDNNHALPIAKIREQNDYFQVDEILGFQLAGEGEHLYVQIKKNGQNTGWVKEQIAAQLGLNARDIGHAGLKDRHAITSQWLSIYAPKNEPQLVDVKIEGVEILVAERHRQKIKPGMHEANLFRIRLTGFEGEKDATETRLSRIQQTGFPNYFGDQRFGRGGGNLPKAWQLLKTRRLNKHKKKSIYLSSLRSFLFNRVLDARVSAVLMGTGTRDMGIGPEFTDTGPMWGRGRLNIAPEDAEFEQKVLEPWKEICEALEYSGLQQERRELFVLPDKLEWCWLEGAQGGEELELCFQLPVGCYATSLLRELANIIDLGASKIEP